MFAGKVGEGSRTVRKAGWGSKHLVSAGVQPQPDLQGALGWELHSRVGHTLRQGGQPFVPMLVVVEGVGGGYNHLTQDSSPIKGICEPMAA